MTIRFGTDGWRAIIGDGYTMANVEIVAQALADDLSVHQPGSAVLVGYDHRFLSERFAMRAAEVLAANGLRACLLDRPVPTPLVSFGVAREGFAAGVVITASHNPAEFNGFKIKERPGRSATPEMVARVEEQLGANPVRRDGAEVEIVEPPAAYDAAIAGLVDLDEIRRHPVTIVADAMHGSGGRSFERLIEGGKARVVSIRAERDAYFGGVNPEPIRPNLDALVAAVRSENALLGLATDGDADRLGAVDDEGTYLSSHLVLAILVLHLAGERGLRGDIVKTVSQSRLIDRIAARFGLDVRETPIGFKYVAEEMDRGDVLIGGEESGGLGFRDFIPERDGVLSGLMLTRAVLASGKKPSELVADIQREFGPLYYDRRDLRVAPETGMRIVTDLAVDPPEEVAGERVTSVITIDGTKFCFEDESWLLLRQSGTEPVLRVYGEATTEGKLERLLDEGVAFVTRGLS